MKLPRLTAILFLAILVAGALLAWWMVSRTDREMRAVLLKQTRLIAQTVNVDGIQRLSGTEKDKDRPEYQRLKEQLAAIRSATPLCRFLYLLGRKPDGSLFFFVDSEPGASKDCSPPGQVYSEAPEAARHAFITRTETINGPFTDRWGEWVTMMVPILDPQTTMYGLATPEDARLMVHKAVDFHRANGKERLLKEINNPQGIFHKGDLYAFAYDRKMTWLAHPVKPELVGQNWINKKDWSGGKYFRREIQEVAHSKGHGWVEFEYENPINGKYDHKTTYVQAVDDLIICSGAYKGEGEILALLAMDIDARAWSRMLFQAAFPAVIVTLALTSILLIGSTLLRRLSRITCAPPRWLRRLEPTLASAIGLVLTLFAIWTINEREKRDRHDAFVQLAESRTQAIAETMHDIRASQLEGLAHFCEYGSSVTPEEFHRFTSYLTTNSAIQSWEWVPAIPASEKERFETDARTSGMKSFEIWQKDPQGKNTPATERDVYYPILRVAPLAGNERVLGYDLGSEANRLAGLEEAIRTGLPSATISVTLLQETGHQKGMLLYRPIFGRDDPKQLRGFAVAVLRMETLLKMAGTDKSTLVELSLLRQNAAPEQLAATWDSISIPTSRLSAMRPVFAFGKVFAVTAHAGPEFMRLHRLRGGWLAAVAGLTLTAALALVISGILRRREELERLVFERTAALRASEERLSATLLSIGDGVITCDAAGHVDSLNAVAETLTGWSAEEARGLPITEVFKVVHAVTREKAEIPVERALLENRIIELANHTALIARNGTERQIADSCAPIHNADGSVFGAVLVFRDVTEEYLRREQLHESKARFDQLAEQSSTIAWEVDACGLFTYVSHVAEQVLGYKREELVGKRYFYDLCVESEREHLKAKAFAAFKHKEHFKNLEHTIETKSGRQMWVSMNGIPLLNCDGSLRGYRGSNTDITERKQAEEALRRSEDQSRLILDSAAEAIYGIDMQGNGTLCNTACLRLLGYRYPDELIGKNMHWTIHHKHGDGSRFPVEECRIFKAFQMGEGTHADDEVFWRADGSSFPVEYWSYPQYRDGVIVGAVVTFLDITERKRAEEQLRKLSQAVEQSPSTAMITDIQGRIEYVNPRFSEVTGYSAEEALGQNPRILKSGIHSTEFYKEMWGTLINGNTWHGEVCNKKKNGELYWDFVAIAPVRNAAGVVTNYVAIKEDITERKRIDEELRKAKEAAESANRAKSSFLANMSHEIRTPMNAILGFSQLMLRDTALTVQQQQHLNTINRSGEHLLTLINDILEMSKIEAGRTTLNPVSFDLHGLINDLETMFRLRTEAKELGFTLERVGDFPEYVVGDAGKLRQILINLLGNAVKFTHRGGITMRVKIEQPANSAVLCLQVEVEDSGIGISEDEQVQLFHPFQQTESGRQAGEGTGLGLTISREFVRLMGGDISVKSQVDKGSVFRFTIRLEIDSQSALLHKKPTKRGQPHLRDEDTDCRILIVDDKEDNRFLLRHMLGSTGFSLREAVNGAEAVEQFEQWAPHLILMDLIMPVMDGNESIRRIRAKANGGQVKIIVLTASAFEEDRQEAMCAGADEFLRKPFRESELFEAIQTMLSVEYAYETTASALQTPTPEESRETIPESQVALPDALLIQMNEAVIIGDFDRMNELIAQAAAMNSKQARILSRLAEQFDSVQLLRLIQSQQQANT